MSASPPPADPNRFAPKLPPAIAAAAAEAKELQQKAIEAAGAGVDGGTQPPAETPADAPVFEPEAPQERPQPTNKSPQQLPPERRKLDTAEAEEAAAERQRYNSAMGRLQKSEEEKRALMERLNSMEKLLTGVQARGAVDAPPPRATPVKLITDEEERDYGGDFLSVVGKKAKEEMLPEINVLNQRLEDMNKRLSAVGRSMAITEEERVWEDLQEKHPDAEQMNNDPNFIAWLGDVDPYSGAKRADMLADAYARHDSRRVINFFSGYKSEAAVVDPQTPKPARSNGNAKPALADYAAPGRATSSPVQPALDKPIYSAADVSRFYALKRTGKFKGREAEADQVERDIFQAQHEGRIR